ncbi:DUF488 domain-containing protein [Roseovarius sp. SCSIO 43702]|uniref:DUF488 domain-containing protein n=1 Tax=Roseovarius sp. SCSIO 43702 TaxID=2823043 RepID=UPI001C737D48|nr:DUF488 domain-containing protein [Roseovarius sp. SCSIO 43702]QYX56566.1 DUF488 domain-containing protein [Roseovarius sp. SCSIO 43702]
MASGFRTVGHSNRSLQEFVDILRAAGVQVIADVRSFPRSRSNPAFNIDSLPDDLRRYQIGYRHFPDLGGRRKIQPEVPDTLNAFWRNRSFHNYADYALSDRFGRSYDELLELGRDRRVAIMCSEAVWWRCHRRIIADYLLLDGKDVFHLMGNKREETATPTPSATRTGDGKVIYPAAAADTPS